MTFESTSSTSTSSTSSSSSTTCNPLPTTTSLLLPSAAYCTTAGPKSYGTVLSSSDDSSQAYNEDDNDELHQEMILRESLLSQRFESISVDPQKGYKATELKLTSFARPHMRTFHASWICFLCAWFLWFSMTPLLPIIQKHNNNITNDQLATTNLYSMVGGLVARLALGPLCDQYGARVMLTGLLGACAIPVLFGGLWIHDFESLLWIRVWVGSVGGALVPAQYWITAQFTREVCGQAMAIVAGWGAMGGGLAQVVMGTWIYPFLLERFDGNEDLAWRVALVVPGSISLVVAMWVYLNTEDCPLGNLGLLQKAGLVQERSAVDSFRSGAVNINAWILFVQFAASLGIELTMESNATMHLSKRFDLELSEAAAYASLFGLMNLWSRGLGGWASDKAHEYDSLRGRFALHMFLMLAESILLWVFMHCEEFNITILMMVLFGIFGQVRGILEL
jgi:NNP family nitrate/nitrite transporter-like MFS transporter